jgi:hypothetical protein
MALLARPYKKPALVALLGCTAVATCLVSASSLSGAPGASTARTVATITFQGRTFTYRGGVCMKGLATGDYSVAIGNYYKGRFEFAMRKGAPGTYRVPSVGRIHPPSWRLAHGPSEDDDEGWGLDNGTVTIAHGYASGSFSGTITLLFKKKAPVRGKWTCAKVSMPANR